MVIKYFSTSSEVGLTLTVNLYSNQGSLIYSGLPMTEVSDGVYSTGNIFEVNPVLPLGRYVVRIINEGEFLGHGTIYWDGVTEIDPNTIDAKLWSEREKMQIRDAQGIDGDKMVARNGQLQKKSEYPYNETIDTKNI